MNCIWSMLMTLHCWMQYHWKPSLKKYPKKHNSLIITRSQENTENLQTGFVGRFEGKSRKILIEIYALLVMN